MAGLGHAIACHIVIYAVTHTRAVSPSSTFSVFCLFHPILHGGYIARPQLQRVDCEFGTSLSNSITEAMSIIIIDKEASTSPDYRSLFGLC